jgi:tRNA threonylcarbamoyladenosine biosynthesis protein TsaB
MSLILHIDTSTEKASTALTDAGHAIALRVNEDQKDHAAWIHQAIKDTFTELGLKVQDLKAVGITAGPGSYTGLRVGMATAKGLCYALSVPLIAVNTLEAMAAAAVITEAAALYCPMIDARRMEVFTGLYTHDLTLQMPPQAMVLDENSFRHQLEDQQILFFGNGYPKLKRILSHPHACFADVPFSASELSVLINKKFNLSEFSDLAYLEPVYLKEFYNQSVNPPTLK